MLLPRTNLIAWAALVLLPSAALLAAWPPGQWILIALISAFFVVVIADGWRARHQLDGLTVEMPELVRLQKGRPGEFEVQFHFRSPRALSLRAALAFPSELKSTPAIRDIGLAAGVEHSHVSWSVTATERGRFEVSRAYLEAPSPFGLWNWRTSQAVTTEFRVYPNLFDERRHVAAIFLRRGMTGMHAQRRAGQGREFEKLRAYLPGDSLGDVHWKASAKRRHLVTKVHQVERSHEVYVIVDASRLSARKVGPDGSSTALERFVTAALILGLAAEQQGDQFGLVTFRDKIVSFVRARSGQAHFDACRDQLYTLQPQQVTPDFEELAAFLKVRLRRRALLVFLTALDDPFLASSFATATEMLARQHLLLVNTLHPPSARRIFSEGHVETSDDVYDQLGGHLQWQRLRELSRVLHRRGIRFAGLDPAQITADLIRQHAEVRARELI